MLAGHYFILFNDSLNFLVGKIFFSKIGISLKASIHCRNLTFMARPNTNFMAILVLIICLLIGGTNAKQKNEPKKGDGGLKDLFGGLDIEGMLSGVQEMLGSAGGAANGKKGDGLDKLKEMAANLDPKMLKDLLGKIDTEKLGETIKSMVTPEKIWEMLPANIKETLPEGWFFIGKRIGNTLAKEWDKVMELVNAADKWGSKEELWEAVKQKTPLLADLLENDLWKGSKERWEKFEGNLGEGAKQYTESVKTTGWEWLSRKVFAPALRLSPEAKTNMKDSLADTFPALNPLIEKVATNEKLKEWADQWQMMAELEAMFSKIQAPTDNGLKADEENGGSNNRTTEEEGKNDEL